jgi:hypothetical protein
MSRRINPIGLAKETLKAAAWEAAIGTKPTLDNISA